MEKIVIFLAVTVCYASALTVDESQRITTGNTATDAQFPYAISLQQLTWLPNHEQAHVCGGALITLQHALTAATCTYTIVGTSVIPLSPNEYRVYAGGALLSGDTVVERIRPIANFTIHPEHLIYPALLNNIAIITLMTPYLNTTVVPVPYAMNDLVPNDFTLCSLAGWGATSSSASGNNQLRYTTKYIYNHQLCTQLYSSLAGVTNVFPSMVCAASYDIVSAGCVGDEGNALVCSGQLTGILSLTNRCLTTSYPEIYTRVSNYTAWIIEVTGGVSAVQPALGVYALVAIVCLKFFS